VSAVDGDDLGRHHRHRLVAAEDRRVTRQDVVRAVLLQHAQHLASEEKAALCRDAVPTFAIEIIDAIRESETEARRTMAFPMARVQGPEGFGHLAERIGGLR
jgi:hypothetical protein